MNATSPTADDLKRARMEYERLKSLRDLEKITRGDSNTVGLVGAIATTFSLVLGASSFTPSLGWSVGQGSWGIFLLAGLVCIIALTWVSYATSVDRERWVMTASVLRTLAQEITELRSEKK